MRMVDLRMYAVGLQLHWVDVELYKIIRYEDVSFAQSWCDGHDFPQQLKGCQSVKTAMKSVLSRLEELLAGYNNTHKPRPLLP